ncbi:MAG: aryl sulfotransferase, partial [Chloroflexota bacterium]
RSRALEIDPRSGEIVWQFTGSPQASFLSANVGGAQRLPNGNTLVCEGSCGRLFEVAAEGGVVWEFVNPEAFPHGEEAASSAIFRAHRYPLDPLPPG